MPHTPAPGAPLVAPPPRARPEEASLVRDVVLLHDAASVPLQLLDLALLRLGRRHVAFLQVPGGGGETRTRHHCNELGSLSVPHSPVPGCCSPLVGAQAGVGGRQDPPQLGRELVQLQGKLGEAVVSLVVAGHGVCAGGRGGTMLRPPGWGITPPPPARPPPRSLLALQTHCPGAGPRCSPSCHLPARRSTTVPLRLSTTPCTSLAPAPQYRACGHREGGGEGWVGWVGQGRGRWERAGP